MVQRKKCKAQKTLKNDALDAKIGVDTAANEPRKGSENLKNRKILERCKGRNVKLEKRGKMTPWTQNSAFIQLRTSLGKGLKI